MAVSEEKELQQLQRRLQDLAKRSYDQNLFTFTGFLSLSEQDLFWREEKELRYAGFKLWGGDEESERKVLRFGSETDLGYEEPFAVTCIHIAPLQEKFADDFSHRDFLGALMNLGIERSTIGDIRVGKKEAYLFCLESIAPFICEQLEQVKHTRVKCSVVEKMEELPQEEPECVTVQVASERVDAVIAKVYNKSRGEVQELFRAGKVYLGGRLCENPSRILKDQERITVRGFGKFIFDGIRGETRKGKLSVMVRVYR